MEHEDTNDVILIIDEGALQSSDADSDDGEVNDCVDCD